MTVPNLLAGARLLGSPALVVLALAGRETAFVVVFLALETTDWLDGKLAVLLDQRTTLGARLDSVADMAMYGALLVGLALLLGDVFLGEWPWMAPPVVGYAVSWILSLARFGKLPSYHTWTAKVSWMLTLVAAVALLTVGEVVPLRVAAVGVAVANLEAILLTLTLDTPRPDVASIVGVWGREAEGSEEEGR